MEISSLIEEAGDWEALAGWLGVSTGGIKTYCNVMSDDLALCYRIRLVGLYCDRSAKSPQQVAEDVARILENKMKNKKVASQLRLLTFGEQCDKGWKV